MKKSLAMIGLIGLAATAPSFAHAGVSFGIFISNAPPPPRMVFEQQPRFLLVPEERVYYCEGNYSDYDVFRYGPYFYLYDDGYWYRAASYRGPFAAIRIEYVPRSIFYVSDHGYHWRQTPRWGTRSYASWNSGDRRFRDWRSNTTRYVAARTDERSWREGDSRDRRDDKQSRGRGHGHDKRSGKDNGNGNGNGQGRGRDGN